MTPVLIAAALAFVAAWPLAGAAWLTGLMTERLTRAPRVREWVWGAGLALPVLFLAETLVGQVAPTFWSGAAPVTGMVPASPGLVPGLPTAEVSGFLVRLFARPETEWFAGVIVAASLLGLAWRLARLWRGSRRLMAVVAHSKPLTNPSVADGLALDARRLRVVAPPVLVSAEVGQPLLVGVRRPAILLPTVIAEALTPDQLRLICAHELAHLRRRDNYRLILEEIVVGLFWLTPMVAGLRARMAAASEEVCDAFSLGAPDPARRRLYAETLVHTLRLSAGLEHRTAFTGAERKPHAMRLQAILTPYHPATKLTLAAILGLGAAIGLAATVAAQEVKVQMHDAKGAQTQAQSDSVTITADAVKKDGTLLVYVGRPEIRMDPPRPGAATDGRSTPPPFRVNGREMPPGSSPDAVAPDQIQTIEVDASRKGQPVSINIVLKPGVPPPAH
jgi:beta-lactamase regulating signal transducer with metallopeptidase domain